MAGIHRDLEQLQTSYSAFGSNVDPEDEEEPPLFHHQRRPQTTAFWASPSNQPGAAFSPRVTKDQDHDPHGAPGGLIIHTVPEESKSRWSHIDDLDSFFKNVYTYHQKSGFKVMLVQVLRFCFHCNFSY